MVSGRRSPAHFDRSGGRFALTVAIACAAIFALGVFIGYHSIYRNISVAMAPLPAAASPL